MKRYHLFLPLFLIVWIPNVSLCDSSTTKIGVLAYDGKQHAIKRWQPTADYLATQIPANNFEIVALSHEEFNHEINKGSLDFILTNPGHYVKLEANYGIARIATFKAAYNAQDLTQFSSVIFAAKKSGIKNIQDLSGKRFAAVSKDAFGGFQLAQKALKDSGINALKELDIIWLGFPHSDIVNAVIEGKADAGTVRSGVLEKMVQEQGLDLSLLTVLSPGVPANYPLIHSVELYPEWPFSTTANTKPSLAKMVAVALLQLPATDIAAKMSGGRGWTIPLDYSSVHEVFRGLQVEPYPPAKMGITSIWKQYRAWLLFVFVMLVFTWVALLRYIHTNRRLSHIQDELVAQQLQLEKEASQRTSDLRQLNKQLENDVANTTRSEQDLVAGCKTMQMLYRISLRNDLNHDQRLQSILDLARQYFDAELIVLSSLTGQRLELCKTSPPNNKLLEPLNLELAQKAIKENKLTLQSSKVQGDFYIVNPIYVDGIVRCVIEFSHSAKRSSQPPWNEKDLKLQILKLISQWLGNEISLLEKQAVALDRYHNISARFNDISPREKQVLALLVDGETSKSAARILNISAKTVELHRANLLRKTKSHSSAELVRLAVKLTERRHTRQTLDI